MPRCKYAKYYLGERHLFTPFPKHTEFHHRNAARSLNALEHEILTFGGGRDLSLREDEAEALDETD